MAAAGITDEEFQSGESERLGCFACAPGLLRCADNPAHMSHD